MTSVFVVCEFFDDPYSDRVSQSVERVFASRAKAEEYCAARRAEARKNKLCSISWEIEEASFDGSL